MTAFYDVLKYIVLFVALAIPGYILKKRQRIPESFVESTTNILTDIAMPFLVFSKISDMDVRTIGLGNVLLCVIVPILVIAVILLVSVIIFKKDINDNRYRANRFCSIFSNCGFLGIPLACAIFPNNPEIAVYVSVFNIVSTFLLLTLGIYILTENNSDIKIKKIMFNPILIAVLLGAMCSFLNAGEIKQTIIYYSQILAQLTTPLSMLVLGYQLARLKVFSIFKNSGVYLVSAVKLIVSPVVAILILMLCRYVIGIEFGTSLIVAMFFSTAVSTAASAPAIAQSNGNNGEYTAFLTLGNTLLCTVTFPCMYYLLNILLQ